MTPSINTDNLKGIKIKLYPNEEQKQRINRMIQLARAVYNLGIEIIEKEYNSTGKHLRAFDMNKIMIKLKNEDQSKEWINELPVGSIYATMNNLERGYQRFFKKLSNHPKFKSRKTSKKSVSIRSDRTRVRGEYIQISGINSYILAKDHKIPENVRLYNTTITFDGDYYWFGCCYKKESDYKDNIPSENHPIGIDVGVKNMIVTSDGDFYKYSDTTKLWKRKRRQDKKLGKDYKKYLEESMRTITKYEDIQKSKNHYKRESQRRKTVRKISNKRMNDIHTATKQIVDKNPSAIIIESISVNNIIKTNKNWISSYTPYMCFYEIHRQLKYKAEDRNIPVIIADHNYASSKICSNCGNRGRFDHSHRQFKCPICGFKEDRDLNAAYNLRNLYYQNS